MGVSGGTSLLHPETLCLEDPRVWGVAKPPDPGRVSNPRTEGAARGQGPLARTQGRQRDSGESGAEVTRAAPPDGVRPGRADGSARTSCAAPEARVGH